MDTYITETEKDIQQILFDFAACILEKKSAIYVAGPLDSGKDFFDSLVQGTSSHEEVRAINQTRLSKFAKHLRVALNRPVIDPGILKVPKWNGNDHGDFFIEIIDRYAMEVWFINGWEFSRGGIKEFIHCLNNDLPYFNQTGQKISKERGFLLIKAAVEYLEQIGVDSSKLKGNFTIF